MPENSKTRAHAWIVGRGTEMVTLGLRNAQNSFEKHSGTKTFSGTTKAVYNLISSYEIGVSKWIIMYRRYSRVKYMPRPLKNTYFVYMLEFYDATKLKPQPTEKNRVQATDYTD